MFAPYRHTVYRTQGVKGKGERGKRQWGIETQKMGNRKRAPRDQSNEEAEKAVAVRATRAGSRLAACWLEDVCTPSVFKNPSLLAQKSASRHRLRKRLRIFTGNHNPLIPDREPLGSLSPSCNASSIRNIRRNLFRGNTAHRSSNPLHISGPAGWLVSFRRAQRRKMYSCRS